MPLLFFFGVVVPWPWLPLVAPYMEGYRYAFSATMAGFSGCFALAGARPSVRKPALRAALLVGACASGVLSAWWAQSSLPVAAWTAIAAAGSVAVGVFSAATLGAEWPAHAAVLAAANLVSYACGQRWRDEQTRARRLLGREESEWVAALVGTACALLGGLLLLQARRQWGGFAALAARARKALPWTPTLGRRSGPTSQTAWGESQAEADQYLGVIPGEAACQPDAEGPETQAAPPAPTPCWTCPGASAGEEAPPFGGEAAWHPEPDAEGTATPAPPPAPAPCARCGGVAGEQGSMTGEWVVREDGDVERKVQSWLLQLTIDGLVCLDGDCQAVAIEIDQENRCFLAAGRLFLEDGALVRVGRSGTVVRYDRVCQGCGAAASGRRQGLDAISEAADEVEGGPPCVPGSVARAEGA